MNFEQLNRERQVVDSAQWRAFLGNPSNESWAIYRRIAGIGRDRRLTPYQAAQLWALKNWRLICSELDQNFRLPEDAIALHADLKRWEAGNLEKLGRALDAVELLGNIPGEQLQELLLVALGKRISESTLYRIGGRNGIPKYSRRAIYSPIQIRRFLAHAQPAPSC